MGERDWGRSGDADGDEDEDDPFSRLLDPAFVDSAEVREPSAQERAEAAARAKAAARAAREADLVRRLAEEEQHYAALARRDHEPTKRAPSRFKRVLGVVVVIALGLLVWNQFTTKGGLAIGATEPVAPTSVPPIDSSGPSTDPATPPIDSGGSDTPLGTPPPMPAEPGPYEFIQMQPVGEGPIAWDPCRPIRYVVNPSGAPSGSDQLLTEAIANTSAATGLQFTHEGVSAETWTKERDAYSAEGHDSEWAPVLISWSTEETTPDLAGYIAGFAGGVSVRDGDGPATFVSGYVVLDSADATNLLTTPNGSQALRAVIQHELGHLVGLGHVADATQLMYTETSASQTGTWGSGDLAGLHVLGTQPCLPELEAQ